MTRNKKELITGDDSVWMTDAYNQAVTEGLIRNGLTLEEFKQMTSHEIIEDVSDDLFTEQVDSAQQVANLFRNTQTKRKVIKKWFGH